MTRKSQPSRFKRACLGGDAGQSFVELALTVPFLFLILVGAGELARLAYAAIEVSSAAKAAVQSATWSRANAANTNTARLKSAAAATKDAPDITLGTTTVTSSCICSNGSASTCASTDCSTSHIEQFITVQTQTTFDPLIHLPGLPTTFTLRGRATQKVANQ
jgi:Flp pilus assembly protein TadG